MLNKIIIHGRITQDIEKKITQSGVSVCNFTVAVDRSYKNGEEKQTDFFTVVCWRGLADIVSKYFAKGKEILVSGEMQSQKWQDNEGNNRISWEIMANGVDFCGSKSDNGSKSESNAYPVPNFQQGENANFEEVEDTDGLPFS